MIYTPFQIALILGVRQPDILNWIDNGDLKITDKNKYITIDENDLVSFLSEHRECVGRIYCHDIPGSIDMIRTNIVECLEGG